MEEEQPPPTEGGAQSFFSLSNSPHPEDSGQNLTKSLILANFNFYIFTFAAIGCLSFNVI